MESTATNTNKSSDFYSKKEFWNNRFSRYCWIL